VLDRSAIKHVDKLKHVSAKSSRIVYLDFSITAVDIDGDGD
jgi:hypothetical protein